MDADDVADAERLQKQLRFLQGHPEIGAIGTWARVVDEQGRVIGMLRPETEPRRLNAKLVKQNPFVHSSMMMSTDLYRRAGGYRAAFEGAEDYDLWLRISERATLANIPEVLMSYRCNSQSRRAAPELKRLLAARLARVSARERRAQRPDVLETLQSPISLQALRTIETLRPTADLYGLLARASDASFTARELCIFGRAGLNHAERHAAQSWLRDLLSKQKKWRIAAAAVFWMLYLHPARGVSMLWGGLVGK
jgi:hypothetical protein